MLRCRTCLELGIKCSFCRDMEAQWTAPKVPDTVSYKKLKDTLMTRSILKMTPEQASDFISVVSSLRQKEIELDMSRRPWTDPNKNWTELGMDNDWFF